MENRVLAAPAMPSLAFGVGLAIAGLCSASVEPAEVEPNEDGMPSPGGDPLTGNDVDVGGMLATGNALAQGLIRVTGGNTARLARVAPICARPVHSPWAVSRVLCASPGCIVSVRSCSKRPPPCAAPTFASVIRTSRSGSVAGHTRLPNHTG